LCATDEDEEGDDEYDEGGETHNNGPACRQTNHLRQAYVTLQVLN